MFKSSCSMTFYLKVWVRYFDLRVFCTSFVYIFTTKVQKLNLLRKHYLTDIAEQQLTTNDDTNNELTAMQCTLYMYSSLKRLHGTTATRF